MTLDGSTGILAPETEGQVEAPAAQTGNEAATLLSRIRGLDAKVTTLEQAKAAAEAAAAAAAAKLADYEAGKVGSEEALRAQVALKDQELAQARKEAAVARIQAKYPETFGVLGDAATALTEDQLAANEARLSGGGDTSEPPAPRGANPSRVPASGPKAIEDMSAAELRAHLKSFDPSVMFRQSD